MGQQNFKESGFEQQVLYCSVCGPVSSQGLLTSFDLPCFAFKRYTTTESWMTSFESVQAVNGQLKSAEWIEIQWGQSVGQRNQHDT